MPLAVSKKVSYNATISLREGYLGLAFFVVMAHQGTQEYDGQVLENLPNTMFKIKLSDGREILCTLSGKMRLHHIKILPGDKVKIEMTPYDVDRGRIVYRTK